MTARSHTHKVPQLMPTGTGMPIGAVIAYAGQIAKPPVNPLKQSAFSIVAESYGWMLCDGSTLSIADYGPLYNAIGNQYNTGEEPPGQFSIPDYRGYFLRMTDLGAGRDPDAKDRKLANDTKSSEVGSIQEDALQTHHHVYHKPETTPIPAGQGSTTAVTKMPEELTSIPTDSKDFPPNGVRHSSETRAKNVYVNYLIKFI